ncbi:MAG TPA: permease [Phycisphaerae bacterium]|nr:permease [Phycisphaerae bacterium]HRR86062.1 permease [Phycisphaerae bacterium]
MITDWKSESRKLMWGIVVFAACFAMPVDWPRFSKAVFEALALTKWYAQEHVLLCLIPAFFIAGAIAVFVSQASVMKYLGPKAPKVLAYGVASVSGTILAVCSCTVLPLFAGIWRMGAGLGPATAFLYSGPAINVLAIILTARILGLEIGIARTVGAILFSIVIGLIMHLIYRREETAKADAAIAMPEPQVDRPLWQNVLYFGAMVGILVFANWGKPDVTSGFWHGVWSGKWLITSVFAVALALILGVWFNIKWWKLAAVAAATVAAWLVSTSWIAPAIHASAGGHHLPWEAMIPFAVAVVGLSVILAGRDDPSGEWFYQSWTFTKQITPLLLFGVLVAGFLLGRPGEEGMIPDAWVARLVGGNSLWANFFAAIVGAFMYFATLTEVPILRGLMGSGMGKGPALALLLAGPALSLPNMLVIRSIMGTQKTIVFVSLVVVMATISGMVFGAMP